jgi:hypothetical protein
MRKVILKMHVSLDGFVARPDGNLDWFLDAFDDELTAWEVEGLWQAGVHIMGRATYHDMAAYWPNSTEPFAAPMNEIPKVVFSRTLKEADWEGSRVARRPRGSGLAPEGGARQGHPGARRCELRAVAIPAPLDRRVRPGRSSRGPRGRDCRCSGMRSS